MFVERRRNNTTGKVELWQCEWENHDGAPARKVLLKKLADEEDVKPAAHKLAPDAICWAFGRTLGNIAVQSPALLGSFPAKSGADAQLACDFVDAGKFRHGAERWWCRTHQAYWGTKADLESARTLGIMRCGNHDQLMSYVVQPLTINVNEHAEVGVWCSMPAAISTDTILPREPKIHVHVRARADGPKQIDRDFTALSLAYGDNQSLFGSSEITRVNVTPPAAFEFVCALEAGHELGCINCSHCGYPHLDLGDFARKPHRKHTCGNCGRDSTWSKTEIVSTPLKLLHDQFAMTNKYARPERELDLDQHKGRSYIVWASTPAVIWTAARPQEIGIHVHVHDDASTRDRAKRIVDDTFGTVIVDGKPLDRSVIFDAMVARCKV